ncbi:MAG: branched-chain amino acid ABC transporter permease, partial [Actinobacteria bacterium]|nr:branched-chain amino acid ABC transporter permease [Actinomycetota bacterium]
MPVAFVFSELGQQVVSGLASGSVYASLALALVIIHRSTGVINFAQGEMAMFATYIAWTLDVNHGFTFWGAFFATLAISFVGGVAIQRAVIAPIQGASVLTIVIVTIGLILVLNGAATWLWTGEVRAFDSPFPTRTVDVGGVAISLQDVGTLAVVVGVV